MNGSVRRALLAALLLALQACAAQSGRVVVVEQADGKRPVQLKTGEVLEVRLPVFTSRGLTLSLGSVVTPVLDEEGAPTHNDDPIRDGFSGSGHYEAWRFRAMQPGEVDLRMDYRLQWEATGAPTRSVTFPVVVR